MELLLFWGVPVVFAVLGFQRLLYRSFSKFICVSFAAYLGLWTEKLIAPVFGFLPAAVSPFQSALTVCVTGAVVFIALFMIYSSLNPKGNHYVFPQWVDRIGGALFGLFTGSILISFIGAVVCLTPIRTALPLGLSAESVQNRSTSNLMAITRTVNFFSLQSGRNKACRERLSELFENAAAVAEEEHAKQVLDEALQNGETPPPGAADNGGGKKKGMLTNVREQKEQRDREMNK